MNTYLVIGLGATGLSIIEFLSKNKDNKIIAFDTRDDLVLTEINRKFPELQCHLGEIDVSVLDEVDEIIASPGIALEPSIAAAAKQRGVPIIGDIELFYRHAQAPIIGITGTNAKSTVTTLVTQMINATGFRAEIGGNIGVHALKLLDLAVPNFYVLELSSFQLELTEKLSCLVAAILNVSANHLDRHGDMVTYQNIKERLYLNAEHPVYFRGMNYFKARMAASYTFDQDAPVSFHDFGVVEHEGERYLAQGHTLLMKVSELSPGLYGEHNLLNALSALAITASLKLELEPQLQVLKTFKGLPHRCVLVRTLNEVRWFNDSKGTTISATEAGIKGIARQMQGRLILILGGIGKGQDFNLLRPIVEKYVAHTIIFGEDKAVIAAALHGLSVEIVKDLDEVITRAQAFAKPLDAILFSPACASYDMFKHFEERGDIFSAKVNAL